MSSYPSNLSEELRIKLGDYVDDEQLFEKLRTHLPSLCRFLIAAFDDETWFLHHPLFMKKALMIIARRWFRDKLGMRTAKRIAEEMREHMHALEPFVIEDLRLRYNGKRRSVNSLLFTVDSGYLLEVVQNESAGKNIKLLILRDQFLDIRFIEDYLSYCYGSSLSDLGFRTEGEVLDFIRKSHYIRCSSLEQQASKAYLRFVDSSTIVETILLAYREKLYYLLQSCYEYANSIYLGFRFTLGGRADDIEVTFENFDTATQRLFEPLLPFITHLHLPPHLVEEDYFIDCMNRSCSLYHLDISGMKEWHPHFDLINEKLESIDLSQSEWFDTDRLARLIERLPRLSALYLSYDNHLTYGAWKKLVELSGLNKLDISHCEQVRDADLKLILQSAPELTSLNLSYNSNLTEEAFALIGRYLKRLKELDLSYCSGLSDKALAEICYLCRSLKRLKLNGCDGISYRGLMRALKKGSYLEQIGLENTPLQEEQKKSLLQQLKS